MASGEFFPRIGSVRGFKKMTMHDENMSPGSRMIHLQSTDIKTDSISEERVGVKGAAGQPSLYLYA